MNSFPKLRRGTKSCYECEAVPVRHGFLETNAISLLGRRRKVKCIFTGDNKKCEECYARGATCVEQGKVPAQAVLAPTRAGKSPGSHRDPSAYSLRERVARIEAFIESSLKGQNSVVPSEHSSDESNQRAGSPKDRTPGEQTELSTARSAEDSAVLSLFNNSIITRVHQQQETSIRSETLPSSQTNSTFDPTRYSLLNLLPVEPDLNTLIDLSQDWWRRAPHRFPELFESHVPTDIRTELSRKLSLPDPTETIKVTLWTLISAERLSPDIFQKPTFDDPAAIVNLSSQVLPAIERFVLQNDEAARTLEGLECLLLLSGYYCNIGKLRKSWHICRRALEYAVSEGLHRGLSLIRSTDLTPQGAEYRHAHLWQSICFRDRYLSMILGLPYGIPSSYLWTQNPQASTADEQHGHKFYSFMASIVSQVIDRNHQSLSEDTWLTTLKIDQELEGHVKRMDRMDPRWWDFSSEALSVYSREANLERFEAHTLKHFIRALLHLPFMLKSTGRGLYQYSYDTTVGSSLQGLATYKVLRVDLALDPYLCTTFDFQAFIMSVLLTLHLITQYQGEGSKPTREDDAAWDVVRNTTKILQQASQDARDSNAVSKQAVPVLQMLMRAARPDRSGGPCPYGFDTGVSCKVTIPCFGEIKIAPGKRGPRCLVDCPRTKTSTSTIGFNGVPVGSTSEGADVSSTPMPMPMPVPMPMPTESARPADAAEYDHMIMSLDNVVAFPRLAWGWGNDMVDYHPTQAEMPNVTPDAWTWTGNGLSVGSDLQQEWDLDFFGP
ncbi:hypothetical protein PV08_09483 [Exophiala spinifera]|uniref:Xylanolytic transcriptional activator regulatory domain-containing protein n=1 Tax=Exophiala spinifera TaxID=91928 RepID=A0A0D1ZGW9_9EURO|nr:uncharacterized protein PV08_09483 [Exophiala spinifera]KIW12207.1 hypothetical protein PV08_09483 [Exophiala spinifera]